MTYRNIDIDTIMKKINQNEKDMRQEKIYNEKKNQEKEVVKSMSRRVESFIQENKKIIK